MTGSDLSTTVRLGPDPFRAWLKLARPYFTSLPVLGALDADRELTLSPREISNAPAALRKPDINHGGKLTAEECGLHIDQNSMPPFVAGAPASAFHELPPVLAALDADHDGETSPWEIEQAAASRKKLDRNHDGYLTAHELIPFEMAVHAGLR
jgi:hypothetical protein